MLIFRSGRVHNFASQLFHTAMHQRRRIQPSYTYIYKVFCSSFITQINKEDEYMFDSLQRESFERAYATKHHETIFTLKTVKQMEAWKKRQIASDKYNKDELAAFYVSLIAHCNQMGEFEHSWKLFAESKQKQLVTVFTYNSMFQTIFEQYIQREERRLSHRKGVTLTTKLYREMRDVYKLVPEVAVYAMILRNYVVLNEYEEAEKIWNIYLNQTLLSDLRHRIQGGKPCKNQCMLHWDHSMLWNYIMSFYRRRNKIDKVFEIYEMILSLQITDYLGTGVFLQILVAISQVIETQMQKSYNITKQKAVCHEYVLQAEAIFIDTHKLCGENVADPNFGRYIKLFNALIGCYANAGDYYGKCRNFWKFLYSKDMKYLMLTFDASTLKKMDDAILHTISSNIPNIDGYTITATLCCLKACCQLNSRYDRMADYEMYTLFDEMFNVFDMELKHYSSASHTRIQPAFHRIFYGFMECSQIILQQVGSFDAFQCFLYMFKFYAYYPAFEVIPARMEMWLFAINARQFFTYHKVFKSPSNNYKRDVLTVHHCVNKERFEAFLGAELKKYKLDKNPLHYQYKSGHKKQHTQY